MALIKKRLQQARILFLMAVSSIAAIPFRRKWWVICERGDDARDNGYWLYRYIKYHHPEKKVYYFISVDSEDYDRVREDAVELGSIRSFWILANAEKLISTHYGAGLPLQNYKIFKLCGLHRKFYFLQHGIIKDDLPSLYGSRAPMRLFICGAKPEYEYVRRHFQHPDGVVRYTGLARFDQLHNCRIKRQILIMPTWRAYIKNKDQFLDSMFYACWQSFLNNSAVISLLEQENFDLIFYPHYELQKYADFFTVASNRIIIGKKEKYDVQTLLKESSVLITDYSSVFFDFAYMKKPIIYYQFDETTFFERHYQKGYFDYRKMGFGDVCTKEAELINSLLRIVSNGMMTEKVYLDRAGDFFPLCDDNNCKRVFSLIAGESHEE